MASVTKPPSVHVLTPGDVAGVLSRPEFFAANPPWLFLEEAAARAVQRYQEKQGCGDCSGNQPLAHYMRDSISQFLRVTVRLYELDPRHLAPLRLALVEQLGFSPTELVLYYGTRQQRQELRF